MRNGLWVVITAAGAGLLIAMSNQRPCLALLLAGFGLILAAILALDCDEKC